MATTPLPAESNTMRIKESGCRLMRRFAGAGFREEVGFAGGDAGRGSAASWREGSGIPSVTGSIPGERSGAW